jgi:hypothetical protein
MSNLQNYYQGSNKGMPLYTMADFEAATRNPYQVANFARGKDKGPRDERSDKGKKRGAGFYGGLAAGAAGLGAAARYGGAEIETRRAAKRLDSSSVRFKGKKGAREYDWRRMTMPVNTKRMAESGGAAGRFASDIDMLKGLGGKAKAFAAKNAGKLGIAGGVLTLGALGTGYGMYRGKQKRKAAEAAAAAAAENNTLRGRAKSAYRAARGNASAAYGKARGAAGSAMNRLRSMRGGSSSES